MELAIIVLGLRVVAAAADFGLCAAQSRAEFRPDPAAGYGDVRPGRYRRPVPARPWRPRKRFSRTLAERLEALDKRLGESLSDSASKTAATIGGIGERLTVIDEAQKNISALSGQVVSLQQVLSNKQARGAFAQTQMEEIVRDGLPTSFTISSSLFPTVTGPIA